MRAKQVNEIQKFERGQDPKAAMDIGLTALIQNKIPEIKQRDEKSWKCMNSNPRFNTQTGTLTIYTYPGDDCSDYFEGLLDNMGIGKFLELSYADETEYEFEIKNEYQPVNEVNFERGQDPKAAMDIGGIDLVNDYSDKIEEIKSDVEDIKRQRSEEWKDFVRKTLVGKTITVDMAKLPSISPSGKSRGKYERKVFTITVQDAMPSGDIGEDAVNDRYSPTPSFVVADTENNMYQLNIDQKIRISK